MFFFLFIYDIILQIYGDIMEKEFNKIIKKILYSKEFKKRKSYTHHGNISVYEHSLKVAYLSYKISKKLKLDYKKASIGAILHDMYLEPWQEKPSIKPFYKKHGFTHAKEALKNSKKLFPEYINKKTEDIISKHMFPLNIRPPKYLESWIVTISDKIVSTNDYFKIYKNKFSLWLFFIFNFIK